MSTSSLDSERNRILQLSNSCICNNLRRTTRAVTNYYDSIFLEAAGLRAGQITILVVLYLAGPQNINALAENLSLDRTTLTRNLKPLKDQRLLVIGSGQDKRTKLVTLTSLGERTLKRVLPLWEQAQTYMVNGLGQRQADTLLHRLAEAAMLTQQSS
jgi:DNA-binding MarR family transcriptional regulator